MSFTDWLSQQVGRLDRVGELALTVLADHEWPADGSFLEQQYHLAFYDSDVRALDAFIAARYEYEGRWI